MENKSLTLNSLPSLAEVVRAHSLQPKKALGQNFLLDSYITEQIVSYLPNIEGSTVLEIGPGPGGLTRAILARHPKKLYAVEIDERCIKALEEIKSIVGNTLEILNEDALHLDLSRFGERIDIISNLPYNIGTALLVRWLQAHDKIKSITIMLQKEVVERIIAQPGTKAFGRLSIISQLIAEPTSLFDVAPEFFYPEPKITSSVVHLRIRDDIPKYDPNKFERVIEKLFSKRRKMIRSILADKQDIIASLGIDPQKRPEDLTIEELLKLAEAL